MLQPTIVMHGFSIIEHPTSSASSEQRASASMVVTRRQGMLSIELKSPQGAWSFRYRKVRLLGSHHDAAKQRVQRTSFSIARPHAEPSSSRALHREPPEGHLGQPMPASDGGAPLEKAASPPSMAASLQPFVKSTPVAIPVTPASLRRGNNTKTCG